MRAIRVGDVVHIVKCTALTAADLAAVYGERWKKPFVVESVNRSYRHIAIAGGGMLVWRKDCKRVPTGGEVSASLSLFDRPSSRMVASAAPPPAPVEAFALRPYQTQAIESIHAQLMDSQVRSTLLVLPTGVGKTATACSYVQRHAAGASRVLWLAHREELLDQGRAALNRHTGEYVALEKADAVAGTWDRASWRRVCRPSRAAGWPSSRGGSTQT